MSERAPPRDRSPGWTNIVVGLHVAALGGLSVYLALAQRHLYADGAYQLTLFLERGEFCTWLPARRCAHWMMQFPAWAVLSGWECRDVGVLSCTYGLTLFLLPLAGLSVAWWAARTAPVGAMLPPLICTACLFLTTSFVMFHEGWVTVGLFWPVLYLLLYARRLTPFTGAVLLAGSVLLTRTYESYLFLAGPVALAAVLRWRSAGKYERWTLAACIAIAAAGAGLSLREALDPTDRVNRETFLIGVVRHLAYPPVWLTLAAVSVWCALPLLPPESRTPVWLAGVLTAGGAGIVAMPWYDPVRIDPEMQYVSRGQLLYIPWILGCYSVLQVYGPASWRARCAPRYWTPWVLSAVMTVVACGFHYGATREWQRFRAMLQHDLQRDVGVIAFREALIGRPATSGASADPDLSQFAWSWAMPTLSAVLSAIDRASVGSVIENAAPVPWQPFDPHDPAALLWLEHYGVTVRTANWKSVGTAGETPP